MRQVTGAFEQVPVCPVAQLYCELAVLIGLVWTAAYIFVDSGYLGVEPEAVEGGVARWGYAPTVVSCDGIGDCVGGRGHILV